MSKSFNEHERDIIEQKLINACKECWSRYGYSKTGIRELAQMANISAGSFYLFFSSKELLFMATAQECQKELDEIFHDKMQRSPNKRGAAEGFKALSAKLSQMPWLTSMGADELEMIARKLPPDLSEQSSRDKKALIDSIVLHYGLVPKKSSDEIAQITDILLTSILHVDFTVSGARESVDFIIDTVINNLFEG
jgi:AcrR family transcriptional regulator